MAILASLPGVEVTITVSGSALPELEDQSAPIPENTATRYIEVFSGQIFEIKIVTGPGATRGAGLEYKIYIDGHRATSVLASAEDCEDSDVVWASRGWNMRDGSIRQYQTQLFEMVKWLFLSVA